MSNQITLTGPRHSAGGLFSPQIERATQRELERTIGEAVVSRAREQARAALTAEALEAAGSLSAFEGHLIQIAPLGEARYRAINDAFALGAVNAMTRL